MLSCWFSFSGKGTRAALWVKKSKHIKWLIVPSMVEMNVGYVLQKFNLSALWRLRRKDVWSALWVEILKTEIFGQNADTNNTGGRTWSASSGWWLLSVSNMFDRANWLLQVQCSICVRDHPASSSQQDPKSGHNAWIESQFNVSTPSFWAKSAKCTRTWCT